MKETYKVITSDMGIDFIERTDIDGSKWIIPMDETNSDYQAYLVSLEA